MTRRVRPTPTQISINILYAQLDNTLTFYTRRVMPVMHLGCAIRGREKMDIFYLGDFPHSLLLLLSIQLYLIIVKQRTSI